MEDIIDLDSDNICGVCYAEFLDVDDLKLHITQYHLNESSKDRFCKFCSRIFPDIASYALHIRNSHLSTLKVCKYCTRVYSDRHSLARHEKKHKSSFYFPKIACSHCIRVFENKKELEIHEYEKHRDSEDGLMLQFCFPELSSILNINIRKFFEGMNENYLYRCVVCELSTPNINDYINHLILEKCQSLSCNICCNVYLWKSRLEAHCKFHKEFKETISSVNKKCPKCDKYFYFTKLKSHVKECASMKCIPCDVAFDTVDKFALHVTTHSHRTPVQFENCKYCRRPFVGLKNLQKHIEKSHKLNMHLYKYRCIYCDIIFKHPKMLFGHFFTKHRDINPYTCKICKKDFRIRKNFTVHIKLAHKSVGFVEFDSNYHVFFTDKKSEKPFQPKNTDIDEPSGKEPEEGTSTDNKDITDNTIKHDKEENKVDAREDNEKQSPQEKSVIDSNKQSENLNNTNNRTSKKLITNDINSEQTLQLTVIQEIVNEEMQPNNKINTIMTRQLTQPLKKSLCEKSPDNSIPCDVSKEPKTNEISCDTTQCENEENKNNEISNEAIQSDNNKEAKITEISKDIIQCVNNEETKLTDTINETIQCGNNKKTEITKISNNTVQSESNKDIEINNETKQSKNSDTQANQTSDDKKQSKNEETNIKLVNVNSDFMIVTETEADQTENDSERKRRVQKRKHKVHTSQPRKRRKVKTKNDPDSSDSDVPLSKIINKTKRIRNRKMRRRKPKTIKDIPNPKKKTFICFKCNRNCYTYQNYHRHMSLHMKDGYKICVKCFGKFKTKEELNIHIKTEHSTSKLTETLKKLLDKRKNTSNPVKEASVPENIISKTIQQVQFKKNDSKATITRVDNDKLSVKKFLETFKPDTAETTKKISISNSLSIRPVIEDRKESFIKMTKFKSEPIVTDRPQLKMPIKFREENVEPHKVTIKLVQCEYVVPAMNFDNEVTVSDLDNTDQFDETYEGAQTKSDLIPEVGREVLLENTDASKVKLLTKTIVLKDLLSYNNVRIGHLAPQAPFYKIVKIDEVLQEQAKQEKVEPPKQIDITLPNGTKLVSVNPLAHLLGNKTVADIPKSNPYKNKPYSYKPKMQNFREAIVKAMKVLDKVPPKRKNIKNVNISES